VSTKVWELHCADDETSARDRVFGPKEENSWEDVERWLLAAHLAGVTITVRN
jgi:hypothetical protein